MKSTWMLVAMLAVPWGAGCKGKDSSEAQAGGAASAEATGAVRAQAAASAQARIGGTVIAAGDYAVEVLVHGSGRVAGLVMDAKGALIPDPEKARLGLTVQTKGGARQRIDLKWEAPKARFVGQASAGELVAGPVDLTLDVGGKAYAGAAAMVALAGEAAHGGQIVMLGDYSVELLQQGEYAYAFAFDASGKAHAAGDLDLKLDVGGKTFAFVWDAATMSYKAQLDAGIELEAKPLVLKLTAGGKLAVGAVESFKADVHANLDAAAYAKAKLQAEAKAGVGVGLDVKAPDISAHVAEAKTAAASAKARVQLPSPSVKASASKSASASAGTGGGAKANAGAKAGFSFGTQ